MLGSPLSKHLCVRYLADNSVHLLLMFLQLCCCKFPAFEDRSEIAASLNYCLIGAAPRILCPAQLRPENVETDASDVVGEKIEFPTGYLSEIRADWEFMKAVAGFVRHAYCKY